MKLFDPGVIYTIQEIEAVSGCKLTYDKINCIYSVVDSNGDFSQYDFVEADIGLKLVAVDGEAVDDICP